MIKDKVIFLDIDGVLATDKEYSTKRTSKKFLKEFNVYPYNEKCVDVLNEILTETDAEIILSSDWSKYYTMEQMDLIFKHNGIIKSPYDFVEQLALYFSTPTSVNRGYSINQYIIKHKDEFNNYVIIDDLSITDFAETWGKKIVIDYSKFAHCSRGDLEGIKQAGVKEKIIKILN